jgi:hypothetical protein
MHCLSDTHPEVQKRKGSRMKAVLFFIVFILCKRQKIVDILYLTHYNIFYVNIIYILTRYIC